jgi:hypothetical protein
MSGVCGNNFLKIKAEGLFEYGVVRNMFQKLVEYPDRRIKPIVYTMVSAGIRIGAWEYLRWKHVIPCS